MQIYANHVIHGLLKVKERQHTMLNLQGTIYVTVHFQPLLAEPTEFGDFTQLGQVEAENCTPQRGRISYEGSHGTNSRLYLQL